LKRGRRSNGGLRRKLTGGRPSFGEGWGWNIWRRVRTRSAFYRNEKGYNGFLCRKKRKMETKSKNEIKHRKMRHKKKKKKKKRKKRKRMRFYRRGYATRSRVPWKW